MTAGVKARSHRRDWSKLASVSGLLKASPTATRKIRPFVLVY